MGWASEHINTLCFPSLSIFHSNKPHTWALVNPISASSSSCSLFLKVPFSTPSLFQNIISYFPHFHSKTTHNSSINLSSRSPVVFCFTLPSRCFQPLFSSTALDYSLHQQTHLISASFHSTGKNYGLTELQGNEKANLKMTAPVKADFFFNLHKKTDAPIL